MCGLTQHVNSSLSTGPIIGVAILCVAVAPVFFIAAQAQAASDQPTVRVVGPLAAKKVVEAIAAELARAKMPITLDYFRNDRPGGAASALLGGRDMMFCLGAVTNKDLGFARKRWKELAPQEHIVAAQTLAIVVHARNSVDHLSLTQLRVLFSAGVKDWSAFGGRRRSAVRRYGVAFGDRASIMFHEKVLSAGKCRMLARKANSTKAIEALATDPYGIAFVDAVAALSAGDAVKIVAIEATTPSSAGSAAAGKDTVLPNAQTIKDGTYPLAETLVLYVSPKASEAGRQFADFVLAGKGDATFRKYGFMPTLSEVSGDVLAAFEKLYGRDIQRVKVTPTAADDVALASQMIQAVKAVSLDVAVLEAMCEAAYDLSANVPNGRTVAFEALNILSRKAPAKRFDCAVKRAALYEGVYKTSKSPADGEHLVEELMAAGNLGTSARRFAEAADVWKKALAVAEEVSSPSQATIKNRLPTFEARSQSLSEAAALAARLGSDPEDREIRMRLFWVNLGELNNPAEAAKYVDVAAGEFKTYVPLACEPLANLSEESALKLAEWYVSLVDTAGPGGKELMRDQAKVYYSRFFELHTGRQDVLAMRAALGVQKVGGKVSDSGAASTGGKKGQPSKKGVGANIRSNKRTTDLRLAQFVAANLNITELTRKEIGTAESIVDLSPLTRLRKLKKLELVQAGKVRDLTPLGKLTGLTSLTLTGLEIGKLDGLAGLSNLRTLNLQNSRNIRDLTPIGRLPKVRTLVLSGCTGVSDLSPLAGQASLTTLALTRCTGISDLAPLKKLAKKLVILKMSGCSGISDVTPLAKLARLRELDLRRCPISPDDMKWLRARIPNCKISPAPSK